MYENRLRMRNVVALATCLAGMAIFSGCDKIEINDNGVFYPKGSKLKQISSVESVKSKETGMIITQYEYDKQGRISKESQPMYENGTPMFKNGTIVGLYSYSDYVYNSKGQLEKIIYNNSNINSGFVNLITHIYSYDNNGIKRKEVIEHPQQTQNGVDSTLYIYVNNRLIRTDKYVDGYFGSEIWHSALASSIKYEYDNQGKLAKETVYSGTDSTPIQFSVHSYQNGLKEKTEVFNVNNNQKIREIRRYYDRNDNLIYLESKELSPLSSAVSYVSKYEYY
ncbi:hypothetical protein Palpr_1341 [Paludibacter propionicigenes WB4]|uniref:YD repeat protein n=1 Tax=Paludibacter propionicigenes (strain DSM 17365 / JCM 13257 / WB4) TaxID=694427 RepID=E4T443_PALPW|nr:hypothetical protein [Paludibacter propionicigenes]ADQ79487.1 hypothetical protein Palpr_1341 [Paludibacter propionicigenes WB4]